MNTFFSWLSGFIDGEGTISIAKRKPQVMNRTYHDTYRAYLSITSTNRKTMDYIKAGLDSFFNETIGCLREYEKKNAAHNNYTVLDIAKFSQLERLLEVIIPYLVMKKEQAQLVLSFVQSRMKKMGKHHRGTDIDSGEIEIYQRLKILNKRGK